MRLKSVFSYTDVYDIIQDNLWDFLQKIGEVAEKSNNMVKPR